MKRVVITGMGAITPLGNTVADLWQQIVAGRSGAAAITKFDTSKFKTQFACEVKGFDPGQYIDRKEQKKYDLFTQYAIAASDDALKDAGIDPATMSETERYDIGVIWASGNGGIGTFEEQVGGYYTGDGTPRFNPYFIPKIICDIAAGVISIRHGFYGPNFCTVSACASSNTALVTAFDLIRQGRAAVMVTGGSEAPVTPASVGGFNASQALSKRNDEAASASRPFDPSRDGFVMGEGGGALILEELEHAKARGARIYAELVGGGMAADAYHLTGTHPEGLGAVLGMSRAIADAGIRPEQIDYVNAHATSTPVGDIGELKAIDKIFGDHKVAISATKSMTGHLLGAAGAVESIICIMAINDGIIPPTINTKELDPELPQGLNIVLTEARKQEITYALNNTFGFGGHTATTLFKKYTDD